MNYDVNRNLNTQKSSVSKRSKIPGDYKQTYSIVLWFMLSTHMYLYFYGRMPNYRESRYLLSLLYMYSRKVRLVDKFFRRSVNSKYCACRSISFGNYTSFRSPLWKCFYWLMTWFRSLISYLIFNFTDSVLFQIITFVLTVDSNGRWVPLFRVHVEHYCLLHLSVFFIIKIFKLR